MPTQNFFPRKPLSAALRMLVVAAALSVSAAHADDYADVSRLMRAGQFAEAMTKVDQYLAGKPRDPQMRFFKGVIQTETGKTNDAIATFTKITEDYPELPEPYNNMAVLYAGQSQFDKARAALEMAIRTNPSYATAHENLGDVYARLASQAYSKALQLDGGNPAVPPKLALIRTLFSADAKAQTPPQAAAKPATGAQASGPVTAAAPAAAPAAKPAAPAAATPAAAPATPAAAATPAAPAAASGADKEVETAVRNWAQAWAGKDMNGYLASYGQNFDPPGNQARKAWEEDRRARIVGKNSISVKLSNMTVAVTGAKAVAKFKQDYSADSLNISSRKTLELAKVGDRWVIVKESTGG
ncbi:MAG: tetratricopeptide repeat protein [Polaromonas sp.]|nr:tetratricopeptide repeat protein [Polaromonas sp.]